MRTKDEPSLEGASSSPLQPSCFFRKLKYFGHSLRSWQNFRSVNPLDACSANNSRQASTLRFTIQSSIDTP
jgi:hypothetical protein